MLICRLVISVCVVFFGFIASAKTAGLLQIHHLVIEPNKYNITFSLDKQTSYQIISNDNRVIIDFADTEFLVKDISDDLDNRFIKAILKSENNPDHLKIILELAQDTKFDKTYSITHNEQSFITIEIVNDNLPDAIIFDEVVTPKNFIIMIDPGHGGKDQGAISSNLNILEKDITLVYAKELYAELIKYPQYKVLMTRDEDVYLSPEQRKEKMQKMKVDLFISLHADSNPNPKTRGASIYTLSQEAITQESLVLADPANKQILKNDELLKENEEIASMLVDMLYKDTQTSSINLAKAVTKALEMEVGMLQKSHRSAELKVLKAIDTPAILIELGYLSNKKEEYLLASVGHKKLFIQALVEGINHYTSHTPYKN